VTRHSEIRAGQGVGWRKGGGIRMFYDESLMERAGTQNMALRKSHLGIKGRNTRAQIENKKLKLK
jgi:hypothetical protein